MRSTGCPYLDHGSRQYKGFGKAYGKSHILALSQHGLIRGDSYGHAADQDKRRCKGYEEGADERRYKYDACCAVKEVHHSRCNSHAADIGQHRRGGPVDPCAGDAGGHLALQDK